MQQVDEYLYRFRFAVGVVVIAGLLIALSAIITATGANSMLDARTAPQLPATPSVPYESDNIVTVAAYNAGDSTKRGAIAAGTALYGASRAVNNASVASGKAVAHVSVLGVRALWNGNVAVFRAIGTTTMAVLRVPGAIVASMSHGPSVSALIRPSDNTPVPVIDGETSSAILSKLNEQKQQEIAGLLAEQLAANRALVGAVVAGDPQHGGYPARWDNARQDSLIDSWGMYNRECVSYAAWKVYQTYGTMPYWGGIGNANQWVRNAQRTGIPTSRTPRVHSVAISMRGYYGHAMWVEKVQGNMIYVSQYNWDLRGHYSEMWVSASSFTYIYFN